MELGSLCTEPTKSYEDNIVANHIALTNKRSPRLRHMHLPLSFLQQEHTMGTTTIKCMPARRMLVDFTTKAKSGHSVLIESSLLVGHMRLHRLSDSHMNAFVLIAPISALKKIQSGLHEASTQIGPTMSAIIVDDLTCPALKSFDLCDLTNESVPTHRFASVDFNLNSSKVSTS